MKSKFSDLRVLTSALALVATASSHAIVSFSFDYSDASNASGFNDPTLGAIRRANLAQAGSYVSAVLGSTYNATINYSVKSDPAGTPSLASAGSETHAFKGANGFGYQGDVMSKILSGVDPGGALADGRINWNFADYNWGYNGVVAGGDPNAGGQYDFISTAIHELTHSLGFGAGLSEDGTNLFGDAPGTASQYVGTIATWRTRAATSSPPAA